MDGKLTAEELRRELQDVYDGDHPQASAARERITQAYATLEAELAASVKTTHAYYKSYELTLAERVKAEADKQIAVEALGEIHEFCGCDEPGNPQKCIGEPIEAFQALSRIEEP
jgi:hypothetical protein